VVRLASMVALVALYNDFAYVVATVNNTFILITGLVGHLDKNFMHGLLWVGDPIHAKYNIF
jgi:hypothetical protein